MRMLRNVLWRMIMLLSDKRTLSGGLDIYLGGRPEDYQSIVGCMESALQLVQAYDRAMNKRIRRDIPRVLVTESSGAEYLHTLRTCRIGAATILRSTPLWLAMTLVHETTHARIANAGVAYSPQNRRRIEALCIEAETRFASKLPDSAESIERAWRLFRTEWWTAEAMTKSALTELREAGCPEWLLNRLLSGSDSPNRAS